MSGHVRFGFAALLVIAFSTPAASNPFTDLFSPSPAPEPAPAAPAPASAADACLPQPGTSTAPGQHWVYRYDGHRKCWFQAEASTALARKPVHRHAARQRAAAPDDTESAPGRQKAVEDARDELLSSAPAQTPQPAPSAPEPKVADAAPVPATGAAAQDPPAPAPRVVHTIAVPVTGAAAQVPPPPVVAGPAADQSAPGQPALRQVDVEKLLADAPAASDEVTSAPPATGVAAPGAETGDGGSAMTSGSVPTRWLGVLLMALGFAALLSSSRTLRRALWPSRARAHHPEKGASAFQKHAPGLDPGDHAQARVLQRDESHRAPKPGAEFSVVVHDSRSGLTSVGLHSIDQRRARRVA